MKDNTIILLSIILAPIITYYSTLIIEKIETKKGFISEDMHKRKGRYLPKSGGLGFLIGWSLTLIPIAFIDNQQTLVVTTLAIAWAFGLIGLYDDYKKLSGKTKVILTLLPGLLIIFTHQYSPYLYIPFVGEIRLTIIYPILIPIGYAVASNAINMMDTFTGIAPGTTLILAGFSTLIILLTEETASYPLYLALITTIALAGYLPRNIYPGKTFNGDTATLSWGAIIATLAILGKIEFFLIMAAMPVVTNGFTILASIKGFIEHEQIKERPTIPNRELNTIKANPQPKAPITLTHLLTLKYELKENEVVCSTLLLVLLTSTATLILFILIK